MTIVKIRQKISESLTKQRSLINELSEINYELSKLNNLLHQMNMDSFGEYLKVGFTIELKNWFNLNMIPLVGSENIYSLRPGCVLELSKINKKTFVFKLKKLISKPSSNLEELYPNWQYRIQIQDMYNYLMRDTEFKQSFENWQNREDILNELLEDE